MSQPALCFDLTPPTATRPDPPVVQEIKRLNKAAERVLAYLQARPGEWVTNVRLSQPDLGGLRFGGRLFELRQHGWIIEDQRPVEGGQWRYRYVGRK